MRTRAHTQVCVYFRVGHNRVGADNPDRIGLAGVDKPFGAQSLWNTDRMGMGHRRRRVALGVRRGDDNGNVGGETWKYEKKVATYQTSPQLSRTKQSLNGQIKGNNKNN